MSSLIETDHRLDSLNDFLRYRESILFIDEELAVEEFGFGRYQRRGFIYPEQRDHFWDEYNYVLVQLSEYKVKTEQNSVYAAAVEHYLKTPLYAFSKGNTRIDGIAPHALVSESTKTIYLSEGNHRCAAAHISHRPLLMKLAPLSRVKMDQSFMAR